MIFPTLCILLIVAALMFWRRWLRTAWASLGVAIVLLVAAGSGPLTTLLLRDIQSGYKDPAATRIDWPKQSLIVLLGMGTANIAPGKEEVGPLAYGRVARAIHAYRNCKLSGADCKVLITGGDKFKEGVIEANVYGEALVRLGIPKSDLILETHSQNTWENAQYTRDIVNRTKPDAIFLVTSGVHMRRALLYFAHFGMRPVPLRSDYLLPWPTVMPMAYNITLADLALSEYRGLLRYNIYNTLGKNPPPSAPYRPAVGK